MSTQLAEDVIIFEASITQDSEDTTTAHTTVLESHQWHSLHTWVGHMKLIHEMALSIYKNRDVKSSDSIVGGVVTTLASHPELLSKVPSTAIGHKINALTEWFSTQDSDMDSEDDPTIVLSDRDFSVNEATGRVWVRGLGDIDLFLTAQQMNRTPVSIELLHNILEDGETTGIVVSYKEEVTTNRHLSVVS